MADPRDALRATSQHQQTPETSVASPSDTKRVVSYHVALARHLSSLIRSATALSRSLAPVPGQTQPADTTDTDVDAASPQAGHSSSSSGVATKTQDLNHSSQVSSSTDASLANGNPRVAQIRRWLLPHKHRLLSWHHLHLHSHITPTSSCLLSGTLNIAKLGSRRTSQICRRSGPRLSAQDATRRIGSKGSRR